MKTIEHLKNERDAAKCEADYEYGKAQALLPEDGTITIELQVQHQRSLETIKRWQDADDAVVAAVKPSNLF